MKSILYITLTILYFTNIKAQEDWELVKHKNKIKVYTRKLPGSDYVAFKAVMSVNATDKQIISTLKAITEYPNWFAYTASTTLLKETSNQIHFVMETDYPWPYNNECMSYTMEFTKKENGLHKITIAGTDQKTNCKQNLKKANGYILLKTDENQTKIIYIFHSEPSQNIPPWVINPNIHEMPYKTFIALRKTLS